MYKIVKSRNPPLIRERDGKFYVHVIEGEVSYEAEIGAWFVQRLMEVYVVPQLKSKE
jgi:hypothetical protein